MENWYVISHLTHWGRDKMAAIFQTTFSNGFFLMKMYEFRLTFHCSLFLGVQLTIFPTLVQVMAWRRPGDKLLSEPMMVRLPTHICVTRPQWVNWACDYLSMHGFNLSWSMLVKGVSASHADIRRSTGNNVTGSPTCSDCLAISANAPRRIIRHVSLDLWIYFKCYMGLKCDYL